MEYKSFVVKSLIQILYLSSLLLVLWRVQNVPRLYGFQMQPSISARVSVTNESSPLSDTEADIRIVLLRLSTRPRREMIRAFCLLQSLAPTCPVKPGALHVRRTYCANMRRLVTDICYTGRPPYYIKDDIRFTGESL